MRLLLWGRNCIKGASFKQLAKKKSGQIDNVVVEIRVIRELLRFVEKDSLIGEFAPKRSRDEFDYQAALGEI